MARSAPCLRGKALQRSYVLFNHLTVVFWTLVYLIIVLCGIQDRKSHRLLFIPLIAGMLNFAWEINALVISRGFYGHVLWTVLDIFIIFHNVCFLEKSKRGKYLLLTVVSVIALYGIFRVPDADGQRISVFSIGYYHGNRICPVCKENRMPREDFCWSFETFGGFVCMAGQYAEFCVCCSQWLNSSTSKSVLFGHLL